MKFIIMADGKGSRWKNPNGSPKHLIEINGEVLLHRTVRLIRKYDPEATIIITSHDKRYNVEGATRYEPKANHLEIDRFTYELIAPAVCFLYGDTYYEEAEFELLVKHQFTGPLMFYGNETSIVAIKINDSEVFKYHFHNVKNLYLAHKITKCIGWQLYASYAGTDFEQKNIAHDFLRLPKCSDFNSYNDYLQKIQSLYPQMDSDSDSASDSAEGPDIGNRQ